MIKLIAIDLDGTAVRHDLTISPGVQAAVHAAQAQGVHVAIATGRGPESARPYALTLNINGPIICTQGALVHDLVTRRDLRRITLDPSVACKLARWDEAEARVHTLLYIEDKIHVRAKKLEDVYYDRWFTPVPPGVHANLCDALKLGKPDKVLFVVQPDDADNVVRDLATYIGAEGLVARTHAMFVEVNPPGADKGTGLAFLAAHLGIAQAEVMAIGDQGNDLPMLRWAGLPIAMGNGIDEARRIAKWVAPSVDDDGVAAAIEKFVLR